tara:strand:- start:80475 stop:81287 length:813 start_codon:yes stop_codon:yes gene_type:complete
MKNSNFGQAVSFIYDNLDEIISLDDVAKAAGVSVATLKRLFDDAVGQSPGQFIRGLRMELAFRTLRTRNISVLEVALSVGYEDQSAFARQFKKAFGFTPKASRQVNNIISELECVSLEEPEILDLETIELQGVTKQGLYFESAPAAWEALATEISAVELEDDFTGLFIGIGHDDPHNGEVAPEAVRFSACVSHVNDDLEIARINIIGGCYARFQYKGKPNNLGLAYHYIYGKWETVSEYDIDHSKPAFTCFENIPTGMDEERIKIYVPLK